MVGEMDPVDRPVCSASAITGTRPAHDTKFSSSNNGVARDHPSDGFPFGALLVRSDHGRKHSRFFNPARHFYVRPAAQPPIAGSQSTDSGLGRLRGDLSRHLSVLSVRGGLAGVGDLSGRDLQWRE